MFRHGDWNGDEKLSLYEFLDARFDDYREADSDGDGLLSVEEVIVVFEGKPRAEGPRAAGPPPFA